MAAQEQEKAMPSEPPVILANTEAEIPPTYANVTDIAVGASDVSIFFGLELGPRDQKKVYNMHTRIVLTHDHFMRMMDFWLTRYNFLDVVYKGKPKNLFEIASENQEVFNAAMKEYLGIDAPENAAGEE